MADYDDSNRGAAWTPFPTQQLILQGKLNVDYTDHKVVLVKDETKDGRKVIEVYGKLGVMFDNEKNGNDNAPDFSGPMGDNLRIAGWIKMKDGAPYISMNISEKMQGGKAPDPAPSNLNDDEIPF